MDYIISAGIRCLVIGEYDGINSKGVILSLVRVTRVWLGLIVFTLVAIVASISQLEHDNLLMMVAIITIVKGILVADVFMDLRSAPVIWYRLMASYTVLIPIFIFLICFFPSG